VKSMTPTYTSELFKPLLGELVALLRGLDAADWLRPTIAGSWRVRDVAAHLLDVDLRKLAGDRDGHRRPPDGPVASYDDIVALINRQNAEAVRFGERLSPRLLTDLLAIVGEWVSELMAALPPHEPAGISVAWAGEETSENWMDIGREYTERWHHQMQIRDAVGAPGLLDERWLWPILDLSVRVFPRTFRDVEAAPGVAVVFEVERKEPWAWSVVRHESAWSVMRGAADAPSARVRVDADTAWRLLYNAIPADAAAARVAIEGDDRLAAPMLYARSVMV
jgi:uncharacterized protein (TIGR03083 family)